MSSTNDLRARMRALCAELGPDDGLTPDELSKLDRPHSSSRLRRQSGAVARALQRALSCASDPVLRQIWIVDCQPDPDATRYRVAIAPIDPSLPLAGATLAALDRSRSWLRTELAHTLRRRRVPVLRFTWSDQERTP